MSYYVYWFPDNTVLINFACVSRLDLLEEILRGRGRWTDGSPTKLYDRLASTPTWPTSLGRRGSVIRSR